MIVVDFDGDQHLGREDIEQVIHTITRNALTDDEVDYISAKVGYSSLLYLTSLQNPLTVYVAGLAELQAGYRKLDGPKS